VRRSSARRKLRSATGWAREQLELSRAVTRSLGDAVVAAGLDGRLSFINPAAARLVGWPEEKAHGAALEEVVLLRCADGGPVPADECPWSAVRTGEKKHSDQHVLARRDGSTVPLSYTAIPMSRCGRVTGLVLEFKDLSLEKEIDRRRETFLAMLGHDLRSPLAAILAGTSLASHRGKLLDPQGSELQRISRAGHRMARMIDQLLDLTRSRLGGGIPIVRSRLDLRALTQRIAEEVAVAHPGHSIVFATNAEVWGRWDPDRLEQVVANLLVNAMDHGIAAHPVRVALERVGDAARLVVHNHGDPIPERLLHTLFDPFLRDRGGAKTRSSGLGLGLYITERVVRAHDGHVEVESSPEAGTAFTVTLPTGLAADEPA
jgi:PAS domain S-box-containing protein